MDRPEIILAPGPTPIPPEVLLAQGSPLVYHRGPGFGKLMREVTDRLRQLYRTDGRRRAVDDVLRHRRPGVRDPELLLARRRGVRPERRVLRRSVEAAGRGVRAHRPHGRLRVGDQDPARRRRRSARGAPGQGRAAHAERDLDRRDPAGRGSSPRVANDAGAMVVVDVVSSLGAVPFDFDGWGIDVAVGGSQKALSASPGHRVRGDQRSRVGGGRHRHEPAVLLRLGDLPAVRVAARPREPVDAGDQRDAGSPRRARAVLPGRGRRGDGAAPVALPRGEGGRAGARARSVRRRA